MKSWQNKVAHNDRQTVQVQPENRQVGIEGTTHQNHKHPKSNLQGLFQTVLFYIQLKKNSSKYDIGS